MAISDKAVKGCDENNEACSAPCFELVFFLVVRNTSPLYLVDLQSLRVIPGWLELGIKGLAATQWQF